MEPDVVEDLIFGMPRALEGHEVRTPDDEHAMDVLWLWLPRPHVSSGCELEQADLFRQLAGNAQQLRTLELLQTPDVVVKPATNASKIEIAKRDAIRRSG